MAKVQPHMNLKSELTALKEQANLSVEDRVRLCCAISKRLERVGEYESAYEALVEFWPDRTKTPDVARLTGLLKAEVLLRAGSLAGWLGGADQIGASISLAKDLLT